MASSPTAISDLTSQCLMQVFSFLSPMETVTAALAQRLWRDVAYDGLIWKLHLLTDYGVERSQAPTGDMCPSHRIAYNEWRSRYPPLGSCISRAVRAWRRTEAWLSRNSPSISNTLLPPATLEEMAQAEQQLGAPLPAALRALYSVHSGQELLFETSRERTSEAWRESLLQGLFGGYSFYDYLVCVRMLSLPRAVVVTQQLKTQAQRQTPRLPADARVMAFAASFVGHKVFVVDLDTGAISVNHERSTCLPAAPPDSVQGAKDGVLRWFEEYAARLECGMYTYGGLDDDLPDYKGICLFPQQPPQVRVAVTRGVRVRASTLYVPERSGGPHGSLFTYSIRFSLLTPEEQAQAQAQQSQQAGAQALAPAGALPEGTSAMAVDEAAPAGASATTPNGFRPLSSCQLARRHWIIRGPHGESVDEVAGDGVVGKHPLLQPGQPEFVYQSCTYTPNLPPESPAAATSSSVQSSSGADAGSSSTASNAPADLGRVTGSMGGSFEFVPGSMEEPTGPAWDVLCPDFDLALPHYVY